MRTKVQASRKKQKNTLDQIVKTPALQGIKWPDIESLVEALGGEIKEGRGLRCKLILNMSVARFHRPHPPLGIDKGVVEDVRDWLLSIGVKP